MKVAVTGGAGFIGSHVVDGLLRRGYEPRIFDLARSPHHRDPAIETMRGDLLDLEAVRGALRGCRAVAHLAAVSDVNDVVEDPARATLVNARGTEILLEAARLEGVRRVVYASTVWVYGGANGGDPLDEDTPLAPPDHHYTATKLAGERHCQAHQERFGLETAILRFGIPFGPRARPATVVAAFVARAMAGKPLTITGSGAQSRQFVYVADLADGVVAALAPQARPRTYNLVGRESLSIRAVAETVRELVADVPIVHVHDRPADLRSVRISGERAEQELGWKPQTSFREGVARYVDWVSRTQGTSSASTASSTRGRAATVLRQEPGEL